VSPAQAREVWEGWLSAARPDPWHADGIEAQMLRALEGMSLAEAEISRPSASAQIVAVVLIRRVADLEARLLADPPAVDLRRKEAP